MPEIPALKITHVAEVQRGQSGFSLAPDARISFYEEMIPEIGIQLRRRGLDLDPAVHHTAHPDQRHRVRRNLLFPDVAQRFAPPIGINLLPVLRLLRLGDVVGVLRTIPHGVELAHEPVIGQLGSDAGLTGPRPRIADDQLLRLDGDRLGPAGFPETFGAAQDQRLAFRFPEDARLRERRLKADRGTVCEKLTPEKINARKHGPLLCPGTPDATACTPDHKLPTRNPPFPQSRGAKGKRPGATPSPPLALREARFRGCPNKRPGQGRIHNQRGASQM